MKNPIEVIDWNVYGALVRNARMKSGFKKIEEFVNALWFRTRVKVGKDTLYKVEAGKQAPSVEVFFGINLVLFGTYLPERLFNISVCDEWKQISSKYDRDGFNSIDPYVPHHWRYENLKDVENSWNEGTNEDVPDRSLTPDECMIITGELFSVFDDNPFDNPTL